MWKEQGWDEPTITESYDPDRVTLSLAFEASGDKNGDKFESGDKNGDKSENGDKNGDKIAIAYEEAIIAYLTDHVCAKSSEISELLGLKPSRTRAILSQMIGEDILITEGSNKNRIYFLKN